MAQNVEPEPVKPVEYESEPSEYEDDEDDAEEPSEKPSEYDTDPSEEEDDDDDASSKSDSESELTQASKTPSSLKPAAAQNPLPQPSSSEKEEPESESESESDSDSDVSIPESMIIDAKPTSNGPQFSNGARKPRPQPSAGKRQAEETEMGAEDSKKPPKKKLIMNLVDEMCAVGEGAEEWKKLEVEEAKIYMLKLGLEIKRADLRIRALKSLRRT